MDDSAHDPLLSMTPELPPIVEEQDDGSVLVFPGQEPMEEDQEPQEFLINLATVFDEDHLRKIANDLLDLIEKDKTAREKRDKQQKLTIERSGAAGPAPGGATYNGASRVTHPGLQAVAVDFAARASKELLKAEGAVKAAVAEPATEQEMDRGARVAEHMNFQLTEEITEFETELEQCLTQLPFGGSQYMKAWWDTHLDRPRVEFVPIDKVYLPFAASNFYTAPRVTHVQDLTKHELDERISSGMYREIPLTETSQYPEQTQSEQVTDRVEGAEDTGFNEDGVRRVYETCVFYDFNKGEGLKPYIVATDEATRNIFAIYRNWEKDDPKAERLDWMVDFTFIPWRGPVGIGFPQLLGDLQAALTGSLRALLDAAHAQNAPSLLLNKGSSITGQNKNLTPGTSATLEAKIPLDDIRKAATPVPFAGPSNVLLALFSALKEELFSVVKMSVDNLSEGRADTPVGTQLSRVEQAMTVYSSIHQRLHKSFARLLKVIYRLNKTYLDANSFNQAQGKVTIAPEDYQGPDIIMPVSDPTVFSDAQRMVQLQSVMQLSAEAPQLYNMPAIHKRALKLMKVSNPEELLVPEMPPPPQPQPLNPVVENTQFMLGPQVPIKVFPEQDHLAHIAVHLDVLNSPFFGMNTLFGPELTVLMLAHLKEHIAYWYQDAFLELLNAASGQNLEQLLNDPKYAEEASNLMFVASTTVMQEATDVFDAKAKERFNGMALPDIITKAIEIMAEKTALVQKASMPLPDPATAAANDIAAKNIKYNYDKLEKDAALKEQEIALEKQKERQDLEETELKARTDLQKNAEDNMTAIHIAEMREANNEPIGNIKDGSSLLQK